MNKVKTTIVNNKKLYGFNSEYELLKYVDNVNTILISMNAEAIMSNDSEFTQIINDNISFADGIGAVMALKYKGINAVKIPGVELWLEVIKKNIGKKFYFLGSTTDVIENTNTILQKKFKNIDIVGYHNGYFDDNEFLKIEKDILDKKPDIVFIALGQPKQEFIAKKLFDKHPAFYMGIGGSFDILSGAKKRAPEFFLKWHLEWFYRLMKEPTRIVRQLNLIKFLLLLKMGKL